MQHNRFLKGVFGAKKNVEKSLSFPTMDCIFGGLIACESVKINSQRNPKIQLFSSKIVKS
jgi:hypothetical protein